MVPPTSSVSTAQSFQGRVGTIYQRALNDLLFEAHRVHRTHHDPKHIQKSTLISIETGGCPENCAYCSQSAHFETGIEKTKLMTLKAVRKRAEQAKANGSTRLCMGSAGRQVRDGEKFETILEMVREVKELGLETCATLGMLAPHQARRLREAGLDYYNHNIDTSPEYYDKIVTTRTYQDRLDTLRHVREAGIHVCTGGILGMGESREDRISFLHQLARLDPPPESVTINRLVPIKGTPLAGTQTVPPLEIVRTVATARLLMPLAVIRLSAGRETMDDVLQALCFFAGANSIFAGDKLLTTPNAGDPRDAALFAELGVEAAPLSSPAAT